MTRRRRETYSLRCYALNLVILFSLFRFLFGLNLNLHDEHKKKLPFFEEDACASLFHTTSAKSLYSWRLDHFWDFTRRALFPSHPHPPLTNHLHGALSSHNLGRSKFSTHLDTCVQESFSSVSQRYSRFNCSTTVFTVAIRRSQTSMEFSSPFLPFPILLIGDHIASVSRRRRVSLSIHLGQPSRFGMQRVNLNWAWTINFLTWVPFDPFNCVDIEPIWPNKMDNLICPSLLHVKHPSHSTTAKSICFHPPVRSLSSPQRHKVLVYVQPSLPYSSNITLHLLVGNGVALYLLSSPKLFYSSPQRVPLSSCRGQERSIFSSSCLQERTLSHVYLSMRRIRSLISLSKMFCVLTDLNSSVMVRTGPVEQTVNILVQTEVMDLVSKSFSMLTIVTILIAFYLVTD
ncbi:unnamed protein product [Cochlearia groenlandica]